MFSWHKVPCMHVLTLLTKLNVSSYPKCNKFMILKNWMTKLCTHSTVCLLQECTQLFVKRRSKSAKENTTLQAFFAIFMWLFNSILQWWEAKKINHHAGQWDKTSTKRPVTMKKFPSVFFFWIAICLLLNHKKLACIWIIVCHFNSKSQ